MPELAIPTERTRDRVKVPVPSQADVIIIGAGLGGLVVARTSRRPQGRHSRPALRGRCATMFHRPHGTGGTSSTSDCTTSATAERTARSSLLRELDISLDYILMDEDGFDTIVLPDLTFPVPTGHDAIETDSSSSSW